MLSGKSILFLLFLFCIKKSGAQITASPEKKITHYTLSARPTLGFVFAHDVQVSNTEGTFITAAEVKLNRTRLDAEAKRYHSGYFNSGFSLAYFHFSKPFLGYGIFGSYFIEPYFINNKKVTLGPVAKIGLSYNSNPYHELYNNQNFSYSSHINPYLSLGLSATLKMSKKYRLDAGVNFNHISNGALRHPNYGMNFPTASLGLEYDLNIYKTMDIIPSPEFKWRFDVISFGSYKSIALDKKHFYWVYGLALQANRKAGWYHSFNLGAEWVADLGKKKEFEINGRPDTDYNRFGVLAGHEFLFKKFNFSQQLGLFVYNRDPDLGLIYHRWGLNYKMNPHWMIGCNLSAHRITADFLDIRLVYLKYK
ncbi:MAG TPA: acyloxyacyl hydrolase [Hanamia sp.]